MDLFSLIPQFGGFLYIVASFVIALSVIVAVHEYGHYIVGRWSGIHAEVFSLGFGPVLWSRIDKHGTQWQVALLPFGGYVKFLGDANAASGKDMDAMSFAEADPVHLRRTMHGAPLWARAATVAAGPVFNFVMSALVFAALAFAYGKARDPLTVGTLVELPVMQEGLQSGDVLLEVEGQALPAFDDRQGWSAWQETLPVKPSLDYLVERDGQSLLVAGPYFSPPFVQGVVPRSAASDAGLQGGDVITAVDGEAIFAFDQLKTKVEAAEGAVLALTVWRQGQSLELNLQPRRTDEPQAEGGFATRWRIGVIGGRAFEAATETAGLGESLLSGTGQVWSVIETSISGLAHIITGAISTCNLSGPIGIAETSGAMASQGAESFIRFIAVLSTAVGLLNLFPVPALDGGHLVFYAYEAVAGRPPSDGVIKVLMSLGITIILSLMVFALANDLFC
ncbi:membrane-associated zinc metalloprotease, putative [Roseobacter sp. SK209-2-6]|uniref:RIP metalloprotease RseP n=1 Tax=Roseobacter sp. SK209-2-6 TaxID=388739 RepID=UPI0000F3F5FD|nr:RIP metalloprotease RseP [Roseobacter sp. SK209-2-6]EBA17724.1 membrane-associated zinc metalloprotease, putative [Roseobacter sp. SK209-2-6]